MFPLTGKSFPNSSDELAESIRAALADVISLPSNGSVVTVKGGSYPVVRNLKVNLDGATITAAEPPARPKPAGKREPGIEVDQLEVGGHPIKYEQNKLDLTLKAQNVRFDFARDKKGRALLVLTSARDGHVQAKISKADIRALVTSIAREVAKQQKIQIQDLELDLVAHGSRSLAADVRIKAKKLLMTGVIRIKGRVDVDDELVATLSDLRAEGEGVVGSLASGIVEHHLKPHEGRRIPLVAFSLGDVALRDLKIAVKNDVQVSAEFGNRA